MNGISALAKDTPESSLPFPCRVGTQQKDNWPSCLLTRNQALSREQICHPYILFSRPGKNECLLFKFSTSLFIIAAETG